MLLYCDASKIRTLSIFSGLVLYSKLAAPILIHLRSFLLSDPVCGVLNPSKWSHLDEIIFVYTFIVLFVVFGVRSFREWLPHQRYSRYYYHPVPFLLCLSSEFEGQHHRLEHGRFAIYFLRA